MTSTDDRTTDLAPALTGTRGVSRRGVLTVGAVGVAGAALAACTQASSPDNPTVSGPGSSAPAGSGGSSGGGSTSGGSTSGGSTSGGSAKPLAQLSAIPVGGGVSATGPDGKPVIISRPTSNSVVAFSAICTHQGCTVAPAGKELDCPCHGSVYNITTGAVINGPALSPLPSVQVTLSGNDVLPA